MKKLFQKTIKFFDDDIPYHAASLSFFTIFSILPLLALLIVLISYLPSFQDYSNLITKYVLEFINPTHSQTLSDSLHNFLSNADKLGGIGLFYLLFVFTMFFRDYEHIVNKIYNTQARAFYKVFVLYFSFFIMIPLLLVVFVFLSTFIDFSFGQTILIFLFIWLIFIILFTLSANKKVSLKAASLGSLFTLIALSVTKSLFGYYVTVNTTYTTIYGSFSVLLFFFLWIYISWNIYLFGTKICSLINKDNSTDEE